MSLRKDDPIYYKVKLAELIKQALGQGLKIQCKHLNDGVSISFISDNGDITGFELKDNN